MKNYAKLLFLVLLSTSCTSKKTSMEYYLAKIQKRLTTEELTNLKVKQGVDLVDYINDNLGSKFFRDSFILEYAPSLDSLLTKNGIKKNDHQLFAIFTAIHYRLNDKEISYAEIESTIEDFFTARYDEEIRAYQDGSKNAKMNYDRFEINDTICMYLPLEDFEDGKNVIFYDAKYFNGTKHWSDTLLIKGTLSDKRIEHLDIGSDIYGYFLEINPFFLNRDGELYGTHENLRIGQPFELYLNMYERIIEDCKQ